MMLCILWYLNPHSHKGSDQVKRHISKTLSYFNPHSHEGSYQELWRITHVLSDFNPHSHEGSDDIKFVMLYPNIIFQSTLPRREWLYCSNYRCDNYKFQSTLPRREWRWWGTDTKRLCYFNPHSHEGSDCNIAQYFFNMMHNIDIFIKSEHKNLYSSINLCIANHFLYFFECESPSKSLFTYCSHRND